jgi:hypothetical protein
MTSADTLPGESNAQVISSIINLVCPQCGGRMAEFQCEGRCCRNWLAEWGMGESGDEKARGSAPKPCCPPHTLTISRSYSRSLSQGVESVGDIFDCYVCGYRNL